MTHLSIPWLELAVFLPLLGAVVVGLMRDPARAAAWCLGFTGASLACSVAAGLGYGAAPMEGRFLRLDSLSAPLVPLVALIHFLTALATARTKMTRFSFAWLLAGESLRLAQFACLDPWGLGILLAVGTLPPYFELIRRGRPTRTYGLHMGLFVVFLFAGLAAPEGGWAASLLLVAVLLRSGTFPAHVWVVDLFENCSFGTALLYVTPVAGMYAAVRLVLPTAPDWVLGGIGAASLLTAVYSAGMAVVQQDGRRFFAHLFLSFTSLVLVGLELHTVVSLTGSLALWGSVAVSAAGLGLTVRALEARYGRLSLTDFRGLYAQSPSLAGCFLITGLACVGFPGTAGFLAAELLVDGAVGVNSLVGVAVLAATALNGVAILRAYLILFAGGHHTSGVSLGITPRERTAVLVLTGLILGGGLVPQPFIDSRYRAAEALLQSRAAPSPPGAAG
jgi:NADH-quinone oxidoreductase subunit M